MSGYGKRFLDAGYEKAKPLIRVDGKPVIDYVTSMFPGDHTFIFICAKEHLEKTNLRTVIEKLEKKSKIISIPQHSLGPVFSVKYIFDEIKDDEDVLVSYCDYYMEWDFKNMIEKIKL